VVKGSASVQQEKADICLNACEENSTHTRISELFIYRGLMSSMNDGGYIGVAESLPCIKTGTLAGAADK